MTQSERSGFETVVHAVDFCVIGGGIAGLCAAVAAARLGARVALMQDRPVLGGNASSEVRMWISGVDGERETGILEEISMENQYRNPEKNYAIWDGILYGLARHAVALDLMLNCSCLDAQVKDNKILSVTGWQTTTQRYHRVTAAIFADCSGDSVLAPLTGAQFRRGREARAEFGEDLEPEQADDKTMGMSCLIQGRERTSPIAFIAPPWAADIEPAQLKDRNPALTGICQNNFWYLELGGDRDEIGHTEALRDELLPLAYGIWDYLKNGAGWQPQMDNWALDWVGMLPGKRESRRYVGDVLLTQSDLCENRRFGDVVAYGGWPLDDHDPGGFYSANPPNRAIAIKEVYQIPYRCLYSHNVENLMFAGRNISATHAAMSSTRVMGTCATIGQAVGTAAALATRADQMPRQMLGRMDELQAQLMEDDCYLPGLVREVPPLTKNARLEAECEGIEALRDGHDRPHGGEDHGCRIPLNCPVTLTFDKAAHVGRLRIVFDSDLMRHTLAPQERQLKRAMMHNRPLSLRDAHMPTTMTREFTVELLDADAWELLAHVQENVLRLFRLPINRTARAIRVTPLATWGDRDAHIFSLDVNEAG